MPRGGTIPAVGEMSEGATWAVLRPSFDAVARPFHTLTDDDWQTAWEDPLQRTISEMQDAFHRGVTRIVVVVPTTAMSGGASYAHTSAAAEAIRILVKSAARQWGSAGVTVNAVATGPTDFGIDPLIAGAVSIAPRALATSDASALISFLCSEASGDVTGQTIVVDGGEWM